MCAVASACLEGAAWLCGSMKTLSGHAQGLGLLLASMVTCSNAQTGYLTDGPCGALPAAYYTVAVNSFNESADTRGSKTKLRVTVTLPAHSSGSLPESETTRSPPYPVIFFLNGFLVRKHAFESRRGSLQRKFGCAAA